MLMSAGPKKILICAPSNAAIDEIVTRVAERGFVGRKGEQTSGDSTKLDKMLLRIGSMEYEPSPVVKKHTLDDRLLHELNGNKIYDLKQKLVVSGKLLASVNKESFDGFVFENPNHLPALQRLIQPNYRRLKEWLTKKTPEEQLRSVATQHKRDEEYLADLMNAENLTQKGDWQYVENSLILKSQLVCCTLSMSGIAKMNIAKDLFDYLIVDEACQCVEPSTLIPF